MGVYDVTGEFDSMILARAKIDQIWTIFQNCVIHGWDHAVSHSLCTKHRKRKADISALDICSMSQGKEVVPDHWIERICMRMQRFYGSTLWLHVLHQTVPKTLVYFHIQCIQPLSQSRLQSTSCSIPIHKQNHTWTLINGVSCTITLIQICYDLRLIPSSVQNLLSLRRNRIPSMLRHLFCPLREQGIPEPLSSTGRFL